MKSRITILLFCLAVFSASAQTIPTPEAQIRAAILAAPMDQRDGASVYGYDQDGKLILLKKGNNSMVCLADNPNTQGFSASCYHKSLEPFMARGRELQRQGKTFQEIFDIREAEVKSGKLKMPRQPTTLFVFSATAANYSPKTGEVKNGTYRYVIYIPYATAASTGLPLKPEAPGMPWIMDPGTHRAHIMVNP